MLPHRGGMSGRRGGFEDEAFWDEFEGGRRGSALQAHERAHADAFFRLQILQMLMAQRGRGMEDDDDEYEEYEDDDDGEEEFALLTAQQAFYEEERRDADRSR